MCVLFYIFVQILLELFFTPVTNYGVKELGGECIVQREFFFCGGGVVWWNFRMVGWERVTD